MKRPLKRQSALTASPQRYRDKATKAEARADDPRQSAGVRAELWAMARRWRHQAEQAEWLARQREEDVTSSEHSGADHC
jgi:hypothetical protein